jgi:hypothetical protein
MGWQLHTDVSVNNLLLQFEQTERLVRLMWHPLCIAALNTPPERASANTFLAVLRDSLGASRAASDMLIPRAPLCDPAGAGNPLFTATADERADRHTGAYPAPPRRSLDTEQRRNKLVRRV